MMKKRIQTARKARRIEKILKPAVKEIRAADRKERRIKNPSLLLLLNLFIIDPLFFLEIGQNSLCGLGSATKRHGFLFLF